MKVAVVLSGELRTFDECYPSMREHILDRNDCDIFMQVMESDRVGDAVGMYKPKAFCVESSDVVEKEISKVRFEQRNTPWMWRNIARGFSLVPHGQYDCVIRARYDLKYVQSLDLSGYSMLNYNIPMGGDCEGGVFDMFAFSSYDNMAWYCGLHHSLDEYIGKMGCRAHPETLLRFHLSKKNTPMDRIGFGIVVKRPKDDPYGRSEQRYAGFSSIGF